jgi:alkanesulfonate monooxygenase SsuD/methylene tetrahydromethanopterin reductase-like flavin-dependent oxidoreductase (luciferase family)
MVMAVGIHIGHLGGPLPEMRKLWHFADRRGFDWFSVADHFQESPPRGGDIDAFESVSSMTAAAVETRHVRVACLVFCISYRNPGLLAKTLSSIDHLSGGRVECALGAGWHEPEHRAFGIPFPPVGVRMDQLEEYAQILRLLFDQKVSNFTGKYFRLVDARCFPKPLQEHLRIWIGGAGERRTLRAVARYADGWNAPYLAPSVWKAKNDVLDAWCDQEGRDPKSIIRTANVGFYMGVDNRGMKRQEQKLREHWGGAGEQAGGFLRGTPDQAFEMFQAYREAGVQRLNIVLREGPYDWEALEAFAGLAGLVAPTGDSS